MELQLFDVVQKTWRLKSAVDILGIFIRVGVFLGEYLKVLASKDVAEVTEKQECSFRKYGVIGTPSVYVNGRYRTEHSAFQADTVEVS